MFSCHLSSLVYKTQVWFKSSGAFLSRIFCFSFCFFLFSYFFKEAVCNQRVIFQQRFCRPHKQTERNLDFSISMFAENFTRPMNQLEYFVSHVYFYKQNSVAKKKF